ncbi:MAG: LapA family protein [Syntrophobacteraceae bacterium]
MRMFKLIVSLLVLAFIGLFIYQNMTAFTSPVPFKLNLYVGEPTQWEHPVYTLLLISGALGFFIGLVLMLKPYFGVRRRLAQERQDKKQAKSEPGPEEKLQAPLEAEVEKAS